MKITILASGHQNLKLNDFEGNLPWSHLNSYHDFLKKRIASKNVLLGHNTFQMPFFQKIIEQSGAHAVILDKESSYSISDVHILSMEEILKLANQHNIQELFVLGGVHTFDQTLDLADCIDYFKIDEDPRGISQFPERFKTEFKRVFNMEFREKSGEKLWRGAVEKWFRKKPEVIAT